MLYVLILWRILTVENNNYGDKMIVTSDLQPCFAHFRLCVKNRSTSRQPVSRSTPGPWTCRRRGPDHPGSRGTVATPASTITQYKLTVVGMIYIIQNNSFPCTHEKLHWKKFQGKKMVNE